MEEVPCVKVLSRAASGSLLGAVNDRTDTTLFRPVCVEHHVQLSPPDHHDEASTPAVPFSVPPSASPIPDELSAASRSSMCQPVLCNQQSITSDERIEPDAASSTQDAHDQSLNSAHLASVELRSHSTQQTAIADEESASGKCAGSRSSCSNDVADVDCCDRTQDARGTRNDKRHGQRAFATRRTVIFFLCWLLVARMWKPWSFHPAVGLWWLMVASTSRLWLLPSSP